MASWEYTHKEFPKVPTLEEIDKSDVEAVRAAREQQVREYWIKVMEIRLNCLKNTIQEKNDKTRLVFIKDIRPMYLNLAKSL
ncbi:NADH-ubiquinone oxidoreductase 12 kDa subunit [Gigaspora margarita]|uniref:NADH-ubiquinone oxidoreductase 12 kDa subunit n=1 Tax=Gigaspora margarita TaxID=4874 RepID=A0A8H3WYZ9_GIGMA|nr:NADH-ubiquinone oxidoreductase 12 kDa subunit [Gigaspora margarita]